jgi:hypothetical protein
MCFHSTPCHCKSCIVEGVNIQLNHVFVCAAVPNNAVTHLNEHGTRGVPESAGLCAIIDCILMLGKLECSSSGMSCACMLSATKYLHGSHYVLYGMHNG